MLKERMLADVYAVVFMDAIHYHVRYDGHIVKRAVYIALGIDMDGHKDVLGLYVGENENAKYWFVHNERVKKTWSRRYSNSLC